MVEFTENFTFLLGTDLPYRKPDTYDLFELDKYDHCAYNSILTKLALRAGEEMALLRNDYERLDEVGKAYDKAHIRLEIEMWDDKDGFYHAWFDAEWGSPSWIMSDTFYGQVWAFTLGLGDLVDRKKLKSHLLKERERNDTPFGLKVFFYFHVLQLILFLFIISLILSNYFI